MEEKCCRHCRGLACEECISQALILPYELVMELMKEGIVLPTYHHPWIW